MTDADSEWKYWIALNGSSCAISSLPLRQPHVTPTPVELVGFPTFEEAYDAQQICLHAPIEEVRRFLRGLIPDIRSGRLRLIQPKHPQPPTRGQTLWTDSSEVHGLVQRAHIQSTSN
jgi:hypothetical protein